MSERRGRVLLIGAGPGDVELLTLKAVRAIGEADLLLVDSLVTSDVLQFAKPSAQVIHVGKRGGQRSTEQSWIHEQMIEAFGKGLTVARIKGGDPLIFARGGEELMALEQAGISAEVVGGVTSATGIAAALGIPLTHRDISHQLVLVAGYGFGTESEPVLPPMNRFNGTLAVYMGLTNAKSVIGRLLQLGLHAQTPVAAVQAGTTPEQRTLFSRVARLVEDLESHQLASPVLIIIGEVVRLSPHWKESNEENRDDSLCRDRTGRYGLPHAASCKTSL